MASDGEVSGPYTTEQKGAVPKVFESGQIEGRPVAAVMKIEDVIRTMRYTMLAEKTMSNQLVNYWREFEGLIVISVDAFSGSPL